MKIFETPDGCILGGAGAAKRWLKANPKATHVIFFWWYRDDLIEHRDVPREELLGKTVKESERGGTAQWYSKRRYY